MCCIALNPGKFRPHALERMIPLTKETNLSLLYLISGPLGVGKSTTAKMLAERVERCVLIEGDLLLHMLHHELPLSWDERLSLTWKNLLALTRNMLRQGLNVVIDFVVEDELEWFCEQLSDLDVSIKYAVLHADKEKIAERLTTRGDIDSLERSLFLLDKLVSMPQNRQFLYDTALKRPEDTAEAILLEPRFQVLS